METFASRGPGQWLVAPEQTGSGTVTIADTGTTARITIQGETDDGVTIDALVQCNQVLRN